MSDKKTKTLTGFRLTKENNMVAVQTPIPGPDGKVSKKTPIFHLNVFRLDLEFDENEKTSVLLDVADVTDLEAKLKSLENIITRLRN